MPVTPPHPHRLHFQVFLAMTAWYFLAETETKLGVVGPFSSERACVEHARELTGVGLTAADRAAERVRLAEERRYYSFFWQFKDRIGWAWAQDRARTQRGAWSGDKAWSPLRVDSSGPLIISEPKPSLRLHCWQGPDSGEVGS
jgi:hypothetical protein